jgi:hypothetical protein
MNKAILAGALAGAVFLSGCPKDDVMSDAPPGSRDEAAAALISVNTVAPWSQVADAVQPNFALKADEALAQVVPTTSRIQEQVLSAFGATLGLGLQQSSRQSTGTRTEGESTQTGDSGPTTTSTTSTSSTSTTTRAPGVAPQAPSGAPAGGALPAGLGVAGTSTSIRC